MKTHILPGMVLVALLGLPVLAGASPGGQGGQDSVWALKALDFTHDYLSQSVEDLAIYIDRFFANEKSYRYDNHSFVQIRFDGFWRDEARPDYTPRLRARVHLPGTEHRFRVMLETTPVERQTPQELAQSNPQATGTSLGDYFLSIFRERKPVSGWTIKPEVGAELELPLGVFARLRAYKSYPLGSKWSMRPDQNFYWYSRSGAGSDTYLEFNYRLSKQYLLRTGSFLRWTDENDYFEPSQTVTFYHFVKPGVQMYYQAGMFGRTEPTLHVTQYLFTINYRQQIYRDWMFLEMRPQLSYAEDADWKPVRSFLLRLDLVFGES